MIPTYHCANFLRETLLSVLAQDPGEASMQIEVIDDHSTKDDPAAVVREVGGDRVTFFQQKKNCGLVSNFNTCIKRAQGELIHILHGDDRVEIGFYSEIERLAHSHPTLGLYCTRNLAIDETGAWISVSPRVPSLESGTHDPSAFFYDTPVQFPAIVVRASAYADVGGFCGDFPHFADREQWGRVVHRHGGIMSSAVLAAYRVHANSDTSNLARTGGNIQQGLDYGRLMSERHAAFHGKLWRGKLALQAVSQASRFAALADSKACAANRRYWLQLTSPALRWRYRLRNTLVRLLGVPTE
jgi:glycosyltransferase involved in cell wall biosynthesis